MFVNLWFGWLYFLDRCLKCQYSTPESTVSCFYDGITVFDPRQYSQQMKVFSNRQRDLLIELQNCLRCQHLVLINPCFNLNAIKSLCYYFKMFSAFMNGVKKHWISNLNEVTATANHDFTATISNDWAAKHHPKVVLHFDSQLSTDCR